MPGYADAPETLANVPHVDNWQNPITGKGGIEDRTTAGFFARDYPLQWEELTALYYGDDVAARIVEGPVKEALRKTPTVKAPDGVPEEARAAVEKRLEALGWVEHVQQAAVFGRLLGDAYVFPAIDSDQASDPVLGEHVRWLKVFDRRDLAPYKYNSDPMSPDYSEAECFSVSSAAGTGPGVPGGAFVKNTRLLHFYGVRADSWERRANGGWNYSILQRVINVVRDMQSAWDGVSYLLSELSIKVTSIKGLIQGLTTARDTIKARLALMNETIGINRMAVLDADKEELQRVETGQLAGLAAVLEVLCSRLAAAAEMPLSILFGQSPTGLGSGEDPNTRAWYAQVEAYQRRELRPVLTRLVEMVAAELYPNTSGWGVEFPSLWSNTPTERRTNQSQFVTMLGLLVTNQIVSPEEAAILLATGAMDQDNPFSALNIEARKKIVEGRYAPSGGAANQEPPPVPTVPQNGPAPPASVLQ